MESEPFITSFNFINGKMFDYNRIVENEEFLSLMYEVETILRPTIEENKLSGKIELAIFDNGMSMRYIDIMPLEFALIMTQQIASSYPEMGFSKN